MTKNRQTRGFSAIEALLVIVAVAAVGSLGFVVYGRAHKKAPANTTATKTISTQTVAAYQRTTTVPKDWKTYTNKEYGFSIAYPAQLSAQGSYAPMYIGGTSEAADRAYFLQHKNEPNFYNPSLGFYILGIMTTASGKPALVNGVDVYDTSIQKVVEYQVSLLEDGNKHQGYVDKVLQRKSVMYDGHPAVLYQATNGAEPKGKENPSLPSFTATNLYVQGAKYVYGIGLDSAYQQQPTAYGDKTWPKTIGESLKLQ